LRGMFEAASSFNNDVSQWNLLSATNIRVSYFCIQHVLSEIKIFLLIQQGLLEIMLRLFVILHLPG